MLFFSKYCVKVLTWKIQAISLLILLANCTPFGSMMTLLAWIAHSVVSSNKSTTYTSLASYSAITAKLWNRNSILKSWTISRTLEQKIHNDKFCVFLVSSAFSQGKSSRPIGCPHLSFHYKYLGKLTENLYGDIQR